MSSDETQSLKELSVYINSPVGKVSWLVITDGSRGEQEMDVQETKRVKIHTF